MKVSSGSSTELPLQRIPGNPAVYPRIAHADPDFTCHFDDRILPEYRDTTRAGSI